MSRVARGKKIKSYLSSQFCGEVLYLVDDSLVEPMPLDDPPNVEGKCNHHSDDEAEAEAGGFIPALHRTLLIDFPPKPRNKAYQANIVNLDPFRVEKTLLEG